MKNTPAPLTIADLRERVVVLPWIEWPSEATQIDLSTPRIQKADLVLEQIGGDRLAVVKATEPDFEKLPFVDDLRATFPSLRYQRSTGYGGIVTVSAKDLAAMTVSFG